MEHVLKVRLDVIRCVFKSFERLMEQRGGGKAQNLELFLVFMDRSFKVCKIIFKEIDRTTI
jgi:hypothetical protein